MATKQHAYAPHRQSLAYYEEVVCAYRYLTGEKRRILQEQKQEMFRIYPFDFELEYHLQKLKKFLDCFELVQRQPARVKRKIEQQFYLKNLDARLTDILLENSC